MNKVLLATAILSLMVAAAATSWALRGEPSPLAAPGGQLSGEIKEQVGATVREYLLANPKVIREVFEALETHEEEQRSVQVTEAIANNGELLFNSPRDMVIGNPKGDITLVEFFDYNCSYCKRAQADLAELMASDSNLRVVLKEFPILTPGSTEAARVSMAAARQAKTWEFHSLLLGARGEANEARALMAAEEAGLDMEKLATDMKDPEIGPALKATQELADAIGIQGTPAYIVGEELVRGAIGLEGLREAIARQRKALDNS
jgi:protein-disulfide isomerase